MDKNSIGYKINGQTWSITDSGIEWNSKNANIEKCIWFGETLHVLEVSEGVDTRVSPLVIYQPPMHPF